MAVSDAAIFERGLRLAGGAGGSFSDGWEPERDRFAGGGSWCSGDAARLVEMPFGCGFDIGLSGPDLEAGLADGAREERRVAIVRRAGMVVVGEQDGTFASQRQCTVAVLDLFLKNKTRDSRVLCACCPQSLFSHAGFLSDFLLIWILGIWTVILLFPYGRDHIGWTPTPHGGV